MVCGVIEEFESGGVPDLEVYGGEGVDRRAKFVSESVPGAGYDGEAPAVEAYLPWAVDLPRMCLSMLSASAGPARTREGGGWR